MRPSRPLVLVIHDDPDVSAGQANLLTRAGYRCLVTRDAATALWFAGRSALDTPYQMVIVISPVLLPTADLPESVVCLQTPPPDGDLVGAVTDLSEEYLFAGRVACS
jgi:hypothetical protein